MARQQMRMNTCRLFLEANAYSLSALIVNKGLHLYSFLPAILNDSTMSVRAKTERESSEIELSRDGNVRDSDSDGRFWSVLPPPPLEFRVIKKHSKTINYSTIRYGQSNSIWNHLRVLSSAAHFVYLAFRLFDSGPVKKRNMCAAALSPHKLTSAPSSCICCTERTIFKIFSKTFIKLAACFCRKT